MAERTFYGCTDLFEVHVPDLMAWCRIWFCDYYANPLSCADDFFVAGEKITNLVIPTGVEEIQDFAFCGFRGLRSLVIPSGVTKIGMRAFYRCRFLSSVTIGKDVENVGGWAFDDCFGVAEIVDLTPDMSVTKTLEISDIAMNVVDREGEQRNVFRKERIYLLQVRRRDVSHGIYGGRDGAFVLRDGV
ncbi:MAG: leucine-rich repeat domain-containing protein [Bacteroidales bacterium]|nr:leucine-rich repeat domain-containing protein [Bacteroidales bacterium]